MVVETCKWWIPQSFKSKSRCLSLLSFLSPRLWRQLKSGRYPTAEVFCKIDSLLDVIDHLRDDRCSLTNDFILIESRGFQDPAGLSHNQSIPPIQIQDQEVPRAHGVQGRDDIRVASIIRKICEDPLAATFSEAHVAPFAPKSVSVPARPPCGQA